MAVVAAVGGGAFVLACLVLGTRLVLLWSRTRELPELCIGLGLFLMGGLGYPLMIVARRAESLSDEIRTAVVFAYIGCSVVGNVCVCVFNWRVFRPDSAIARAATILIAFLLTALFAAQLVDPGLLAFAVEQRGPWVHAMYLASLGYLWAGTESAVYYATLRRRQRIGLADPVVADRFRLWAIGTLTAVTISVVGIVYQLLGLDFRAGVAGALTIGSLGLVTAAAMWLAFLPPEAYLERVRARAGV